MLGRATRKRASRRRAQVKRGWGARTQSKTSLLLHKRSCRAARRRRPRSATAKPNISARGSAHSRRARADREREGERRARARRHKSCELSRPPRSSCSSSSLLSPPSSLLPVCLLMWLPRGPRRARRPHTYLPELGACGVLGGMHGGGRGWRGLGGGEEREALSHLKTQSESARRKRTDLVARLPGLDGHDLPHGCCCARFVEEKEKEREKDALWFVLSMERARQLAAAGALCPPPPTAAAPSKHRESSPPPTLRQLPPFPQQRLAVHPPRGPPTRERGPPSGLVRAKAGAGRGGTAGGRRRARRRSVPLLLPASSS